MDKISDLPKIILHDILSRLPYKDAARTSVLSKAWHETWSSFPILVFHGFDQGVFLRFEDTNDPLKIQDHRRKVSNFLNSVDRTLVRFHHHGFAIKEFSLSMTFFHPQFMPHRVDRWMKIVGESSSIQVLKLKLKVVDYCRGFEFDSDTVDNYYCLPPDVVKAKSLTELELSGKIRVDKLFVNHRIRFPMLRILSLIDVYLGHDQAMEDLISGCPMIEDLKLEHCVGLENVKVHDLPKLKSAKFYGFREIHVDVPSLEYLHLGNDELEFPCDINIDKCRNLKVLLLEAVSSVFVSNQWLLELFDKFPSLERLELCGCITSESLMISSSRLKVLSFWACLELKEAKIDAPNLESCRYFGTHSHMPAAISFVNCSNKVEFDAVFAIEFRLDLEWLRAFFQHIEPRNVTLSLRIMKDSSGHTAGLFNLGNTCYMNSTLQCLHSVPELKSALIQYSHSGRNNDVDQSSHLLTVATRDLFNELDKSVKPVAPMQFWMLLRKKYPQFGQLHNGVFMQQDAEECWTQLLYTLSQSLRSNGSSENADAVKALFGIELISRIHCQESNEESSETESVYSLKCHISQEVNHLHEGIKQGLKSELEKASPALGRSANYLKESRINALPRYLTVQFVRFFWKRESNQKAKILRKVDYPLELDVYDFCSDDLRKKLEAPRKLLRDEEGKKLGLKGSEKSSVQKDNDEKMADAEGSSNGGGEPSVAPMEEGEKATQMTGIYDLVAVLTHKGRSADSGHYVGWVKQENGKWIEFDDDNPKPRIEDDITRLSGGGDWHMAYIIMYKARVVSV